MHFKDFVTYTEELKCDLYENSLYKDATERTDLLNDKQKVAEAFLFNFIGILGMLNGNTHTRDAAMLRKYFMSDKKLRIDTISDENNDMSLVIKLAKEADFFKNDTVVQQITRFLAKVKLGQITAVDSKVIGTWMKNLKPEFIRYIKEPQLRAEFELFQKDGGETIDISRLAVLLKKKMKILTMGGEFVPFAKRFKIVEKTPADIAAILGTVTDTDNSSDSVVDKSKAAFDAVNSGVSTKRTKYVTPVPVVKPEPPKPKPFGATKISTANLYRFGFFDFRNKNDVFLSAIAGSHIFSDDEKDIISETRNYICDKLKEISDLKAISVSQNIKDIIEKLNSSNFLVSNITFNEFLYDINKFDSYFDRFIFSFAKYLRYVIAFETGNPIDNMFASYYFKEYAIELHDVFYKTKLAVSEQMFNDMFFRFNYIQLLNQTSSGYQISREAISGFVNLMLMIHYKKESFNGIMSSVLKEHYRNGPTSAMIKLLFNFDPEKQLNTKVVRGVDLVKVWKDLKADFYATENIDPYILELIYNLFFKQQNIEEVHDYILKRYKNDLLENGYENSLFFKEGLRLPQSIAQANKVLQKFDIDLNKWSAKFPDDIPLFEYKVLESGMDGVSLEKAIKYADYSAMEYVKNSGYSINTDIRNTALYRNKILSFTAKYYRRSSLSDANSKIIDVLCHFIDQNPTNFDDAGAFSRIMKILPDMDKKDIIELVQTIKKNNIKNFFDASYYKNVGRRDAKEEFVSIFTGIMNDLIGTDLEDYISDILEQMPGGVIGKIKTNLVGANKLVQEVNNGVIKPFGIIDDKRLKIMLAMNNINLGAIISADIGRKKKGEKWADYFKRTAQASKQSNSDPDKKYLQIEKVKLLNVDTKDLTRTYNKSFRSNKHGDVYTKIIKVFDADIKFPEFDEFRKTNFGDGSIEPAFHGTGGVAATMILRYGFKVIKSSDSSVVGRMLGDGIYFTNKLDKSMQYVGNDGYGRNEGGKGYILELDTNLGRKAITSNGPDYRVMGLGSDNIRSPEWCVRDPKKQLAIVKVYEVERVRETTLKKYLGETNGFLGFKDYLKENKLMNMDTGVVSYIFRDGLIPIFKKNEKGIYEEDFIDFEEALEQKLIPATFIDYSMHGPVVVFSGTKQTETFDIRFAEAMNGKTFKLYEQLFLEKVIKEDENI